MAIAARRGRDDHAGEIRGAGGDDRRAALGQPWLVGDIAYFLRKGHERPALPRETRRAAAENHYATLLDLMGPRQGLRHARKHLAAYADVAASQGSGLDAEARRRLVASEDVSKSSALSAGSMTRCLKRRRHETQYCTKNRRRS